MNEINVDFEKILLVSGSVWSNLKFLEWWILLRGCEGEIWERMEFYSSSETFVVLTSDQFVGRDDGLLKQQR